MKALCRKGSRGKKTAAQKQRDCWALLGVCRCVSLELRIFFRLPQTSADAPSAHSLIGHPLHSSISTIVALKPTFFWVSEFFFFFVPSTKPAQFFFFNLIPHTPLSSPTFKEPHTNSQANMSLPARFAAQIPRAVLSRSAVGCAVMSSVRASALLLNQQRAKASPLMTSSSSASSSMRSYSSRPADADHHGKPYLVL